MVGAALLLLLDATAAALGGGRPGAAESFRAVARRPLTAHRFEEQNRMVARHAFMLVLACALAVGCGGHEPTGQRDRPATVPRPTPVVVGEGRLVPIGGGRSLYLKCVGSGTPTIILEAGFGGSSDNWREVHAPLGRTTRTCAYDRAGLGNSLPIPGTHDAGDEISDLRRLLDHARIAPPYVLVGHSYGGLLVRLFANAYPDATAGLVLVESMGQNQDRRLLSIWRAQPARVRRVLPKPGASRVEDGVDIIAGEALDGQVRTLGDTPLAVITRGRPDDSDPLPASVRPPVDRLWTRMQDELAALSSDHVHVTALRSGHFVQRTLNGQPDVVIAAVRAVVRAARTGTQLPPCRRVFHGSGVRCHA
jgi:pimeloyl-ACP methyl ester carboxylesterase